MLCTVRGRWLDRACKKTRPHAQRSARDQTRRTRTRIPRARTHAQAHSSHTHTSVRTNGSPGRHPLESDPQTPSAGFLHFSLFSFIRPLSVRFFFYRKKLLLIIIINYNTSYAHLSYRHHYNMALTLSAVVIVLLDDG